MSRDLSCLQIIHKHPTTHYKHLSFPKEMLNGAGIAGIEIPERGEV